MEEFIRKLPKSELHLHIEGSLEPELMFKLAKRNKIELPFKDVAAVRQAYEFSNLQTFLDIYYQGANVLRSEEDFHDLTFEYLLRCKEDGVVHTELFFDPQTHTDRDVPFGTVIKGLWSALEKGRSELAISSKLILCFLRHLDEASAIATWKEAQPYLDKITAVGLDSSEVGHPPEKFAKVFARAIADGVKTVAHAGEEGPPAYIWGALDSLHVSRIDHGVRCLEDPKLVARLVEEKIPLTVCPLSNVKLRVFRRLEEHNLLKLLDAGLVVTINSDDPAYFGGYLLKNFTEVVGALGLSKSTVKLLATNSINASFLSESEKGPLLAAIEASS